MKPYYDHAGKCQCGCGELLNSGRRFVSGHNLRVLVKTETHRKRIGEAQKRAWATGRPRMPLGTTYKDSSGYIRVKVIPGNGRWKLEHIIVMEGAIGRPLTPGEIVHHINGIRDDNRIENLYLCESNKHHQQVHRTQDAALRECLAAGLVTFEDGTYKTLLPR